MCFSTTIFPLGFYNFWCCCISCYSHSLAIFPDYFYRKLIKFILKKVKKKRHSYAFLWFSPVSTSIFDELEPAKTNVKYTTRLKLLFNC